MSATSGIEISAFGAPVSTAQILRCLQAAFRVRCHIQQARLMSHYQLLQPHQLVVDDSLSQDEIVVEDLDGAEYGRIVGLYCPD